VPAEDEIQSQVSGIPSSMAQPPAKRTFNLHVKLPSFHHSARNSLDILLFNHEKQVQHTTSNHTAATTFEAREN
jgi:hypothetical protein